jgi:hypothetical protein
VKFVLARRAKGPANRAEAWACVTANLALPGSGSLAAGKSIGYYQLALTAVGFVLSLISGLHLMGWMLENWTRINQSTGDPFDNLAVLWDEIRWPLAGLGIFAISLLWAGITSAQILVAHPKNPVPPRII